MEIRKLAVARLVAIVVAGAAVALAACSPRQPPTDTTEEPDSASGSSEVGEGESDAEAIAFESSTDDETPTPDESSPVTFERQLSFGDTTFTLKAYGSDDRKLIVVQASRAGEPVGDTARAPVNGDIVNASATDLDADESPEVLVFTRSRTEHRRGSFAGFAFVADQFTPLSLPALDARQAPGYRGGDAFTVAGSQVVRRFPVFEGKGDQPTAKTRTITYSLQPGFEFSADSTDD